MDKADWIAVDWGTTHLRLWMMDAQDQVIASRCSDQGMARLSPGGFEPALRSLLDAPLPPQTLVLCAGMVGARQGWAEAPYRTVPCTPLTMCMT